MYRLLSLLFLIILVGCGGEEDKEILPKYNIISTLWVANHSWEKLERVALDGTIRKRAYWIDRYGTYHYYENQWQEYSDSDSISMVNYNEVRSLTFKDSVNIDIETSRSIETVFGEYTVKFPTQTPIYLFHESNLRGEWWTPIPGGKFGVHPFVIIPKESKMIIPNQSMPDGNRLTFFKKENY
ncbi:MAG: hypothetical protein BWY38_02967 [Ignavibacteria bacterium ADurb.Bin266]|nr:MAG: hypothetical protein BWY38_02967 [Ignavibacteria bacterium ADurb.Bin266]